MDDDETDDRPEQVRAAERQRVLLSGLRRLKRIHTGLDSTYKSVDALGYTIADPLKRELHAHSLAQIENMMAEVDRATRGMRGLLSLDGEEHGDRAEQDGRS